MSFILKSKNKKAMCYGCYVEEGSPKVINDKTKKAAELIKLALDHPENGAGGIGHIVLDDWNLEDDSINFCLNEPEERYDIAPEANTLVKNCLRYLLELTIDERYSAMAIHDKFIEV